MVIKESLLDSQPKYSQANLDRSEINLSSLNLVGLFKIVKLLPD